MRGRTWWFIACDRSCGHIGLPPSDAPSSRHPPPPLSMRAGTSELTGPDLGVQTWCAEAVVDGRMDFDDLPLDERLLRAVADEGYRTPTPVQAMTIPALLDGRDVLGVAQTGTGKTAAFALPILHHLASERPAHGRPIRALILSPTRELAAQIGDRVRAYGHALPLQASSSSVAWGTCPRSRPSGRASTSSSPRPDACSIWRSRVISICPI